MKNTKNRNNADKIGRFIASYIYELHKAEPDTIHIFTPTSLLELALMQYGYSKVKKFSLDKIVKITKEFVPAVIKNRFEIRYEI
jgi:hypothetical protein